MLEKLVSARRLLRPIKNGLLGLKKTETKEYHDTNILEISIPYLCFGNIKIFCIDKEEHGTFITGGDKETVEECILRNFETQKTGNLTYEKWENDIKALHYFDATIYDSVKDNIYEMIMRITQQKTLKIVPKFLEYQSKI